MQPVRIQRSRKYKQVSPNGLPIVYVGRPGKWGNHFKIGMDGIGNNKNAADAYKTWIKHSLTGSVAEAYAKLELRGKNLSCWCKVGEPCHADILLELANA